MLNITYRYLYNSPWGLFEGVPQRLDKPEKIKQISQALKLGWLEGVGLVVYCNNKPIKLLWKGDPLK